MVLFRSGEESGNRGRSSFLPRRSLCEDGGGHFREITRRGRFPLFPFLNVAAKRYDFSTLWDGREHLYMVFDPGCSRRLHRFSAPYAAEEALYSSHPSSLSLQRGGRHVIFLPFSPEQRRNDPSFLGFFTPDRPSPAGRGRRDSQ